MIPVDAVQWKTCQFLELPDETFEYSFDLPMPLADWDVFASWERERFHSMRDNLDVGDADDADLGRDQLEDGLEDALDTGLVDVTRNHLQGPGVFTWWSYRPGQFEANRGLRIDLALCSPDVARRVRGVSITPGEIEFTRILSFATSAARMVVRWISPALVVQ